MEIRKMWFKNGKGYAKRLSDIEEIAKKIWRTSGTCAWYVLHDHRHSEKVEEYIGRLIPENCYEALSLAERFLLIAAAWTHDLGMSFAVAGKEGSYDEIRDEHHINSAEWVLKHQDDLGLDSTEAPALYELCLYHRKSVDIHLATEKHRKDIRTQLLASYFRLADALHIDSSRVPKNLYETFRGAGMPWESRFHWLKSKWVNDVSPNPEDLTIAVSMNLPDVGEARVEAFKSIIKSELEEELDSVWDVLVHGKITYYLDVKTKVNTVPSLTPDAAEVEQVIDHLILMDRASASDLADSVIDTVLRLAAQKNVKSAFTDIRDYSENVISGLAEARSCQVLLRVILRIIDDATGSVAQNRRGMAGAMKKLSRNLNSFRMDRERKLKRVYTNAKPILADGHPILLFGYSKTVIRSLSLLPKKIKGNTVIYICQCSSKSRFNHRNELIYCDGIEYARDVASIGFQKVNIVPDTAIANLMEQRAVRKVVFGANGIDRESGLFGHTAGHLIVSDMARMYNVPVFVITDSSKFGEVRRNLQSERKTTWLTGDKSLLSELNELGIGVKNPREDCLDLKKKPSRGLGIYLLVTDLGIFPPTQIPDL